jgi:ATP-dependent DNA ligase
MLRRTQTVTRRRPHGFIDPCIPTLATKPPAGPQWIHEIKHDGYRLIARRHRGRVRLFTRRGHDWADRYPLIGEAMAGLAQDATIDGEVVVCDVAGVADFGRLHSREHDRHAFLYAFDLLELDGLDLRPFPLERRKDQLRRLLFGYAHGVQFNEHLEGDGATVFARACRLGCEGIVSKDRSRPYRSGKSKTWIKVKNPKAPGVLRFEDRS